MNSIRHNLQLWILAALGLGGAVMVLVSYTVTLTEMGEQFDANLEQVALSIAEHHPFGTEYSGRLRADLPGLPKIFEEDGDFDFVTSTRTPDGRLIFSSDPHLDFPHPDTTGLSDVVVGGDSWRLYTLILKTGVVEVAQRASVRSLLAAATAARVAVPPMFLIALVALLIGVALRRGLAPLDGLATEIASRSPESLDPVGSEGIPSELAALTEAMNGLIARVASTLEVQRRFVADAAHELRTPITALRLQLQLVERSDDAQRDEALRKLHAGIERAQRVVTQMLQLSKLATDVDASHERRVDLTELAREVVVEFEWLARQRGVDLGVDLIDSTDHQPVEPVLVRGDAGELRILAGNLVDNALRYSPAGSIVDVRSGWRGGRAVLEVADTGPGIDETERVRVFDRFFRGSGSAGQAGTGLGLAIVRAIADRHHAEVALDAGRDGRGLVVTVQFGQLTRLEGMSKSPQERSQPDIEGASFPTQPAMTIRRSP